MIGSMYNLMGIVTKNKNKKKKKKILARYMQRRFSMAWCLAWIGCSIL